MFLLILAIAMVLYFADGQSGNPPFRTSAIIRIATKPMTEQFILGEMLSQLIEAHTPLGTVVTKGIGGGTANIHPALLKGEFDLYPEYTGTAWNYVLKKKERPEERELFTQLQRDYRERFGLEWVGLYGFNNTFGIAMRRDLARERQVGSISQLAHVSKDLVFGAEYDFYERDDGFQALCREYGLAFKRHIDMDIGLKYPALASRKIDVMNVATTDGLLGASEAELLDDDRDFYQTYYCGTVIREDTLAANPGLREVLLKMENILTEWEMAGLNHEVEVNGREDREVAREFLAARGLLP
jgi:osmoprotectant transport system permease protein